MGPLPRRHPREESCTKAQIALKLAIQTICREHDLTDAESLRVVTAAMSTWIGDVAKYAIRMERHGDTNKPGGWE